MNIQRMNSLQKILLSGKHKGFEQTIFFIDLIDNLPILAGFFLPLRVEFFQLNLQLQSHIVKSPKTYKNGTKVKSQACA
ncbi:MAG: hypothetical protein PWR03_1895 [Tenuifilum sp.]|jgi:hypothetical protein|nr:hypothetical protein [Tenuifilum sp.]